MNILNHFLLPRDGSGDHVANRGQVPFKESVRLTYCLTVFGHSFPSLTAGPSIWAAAGLILVFSLMGLNRARVYSSSERLLRDTLGKNPSAWAAQNDLGCILAQRQDYGEAISHFQAAVQSNPEYHDARLNLGQALAVQGRFEEADEQFMAALELKPHGADGHKRFARSLEMRGRQQEAVRHLRVALSFQPEIQTHMELSGLLYQTGDFGRALTELRKVLALKPDMPEALNNVAWLLATCRDDRIRNGQEAISCARRACRLTACRQPRIIATLAAAYAEAGKFPAAIAAEEMALRLERGSAETPTVAVGREMLHCYQGGRPWRETQTFPKGQL